MRVAVFYSSIPTDGGSYGYENSLEEILESLSETNDYEFISFRPSGRARSFQSEGMSTIKSNPYRVTFGTLVLIWALRSMALRNLLALFGLKKLGIERKLVRMGIDLVYFASPNPLALGILNIPIATTIWDIGHRDLPEFPEFSENGKWFNREYYFRDTVPRSTFVAVDSLATQGKLERLYGLNPDRGYPLGLLPKSRFCTCTEIDNELPKVRFVLYPAQKWSHKNHIALIRALKVLKREGSDIHLVLTGSDKGNEAQIHEASRLLGVDDRLIDLGFVSDHTLTHLFNKAEAIVMPSLLGPTNLPPLEALLSGKQAIVSSAHRFDGLENEGALRHVENNDGQSWAKAINSALSEFVRPEKELRRVLNEKATGLLAQALDFASTRLMTGTAKDD